MNKRPNTKRIDPNLRNRFADHPHHEATVYFCENYDEVSFAADYDTLPLEFFEPMVRNIFARKPWSGVDGAIEEPARSKADIASAYPE